MKLTLKKNQDPEYLESNIASLKTSYGCRIEEKLKIAAIVKADGKHYLADICSETTVFKRAGGNVTSADLIQAMMESFRISGKADSDTNDSSDEDKVILAATEFKFSCNLCGKGGHKAKDCPQRNKIKCEHCGRLGHTKATCWKLEANKSKGRSGGMTWPLRLLMKASSSFEQVGVRMRMLKSFCKLYHCLVVSVQKSCCDIEKRRVS